METIVLQAETNTQSVANRFEKRGTFRVSNPVLSVEINGTRFSTENWSLDGMLLNGLADHVEPGKPIEGIIGPIGSPEMCRFGGCVVRIDEDEMTTAIELDEKNADVAALLPLWVLKYSAR
ncbi:hypothetical protein [Sneathiella litorea]|uniref:PilZ domain-containing protein n=1 Tax=Sneathiella litorea TaxID=2606216 RepID=A0A6L8W522_9PROT|nr:hypothetical protein [Sneathiella litorea]MZR30225.1 hypothetical protein [Sneathiella litorea]